MTDKNFDYDVDLFGTDFEAIKNSLLKMCEFYANQHLPYITIEDRQDLEYIDFGTKSRVVIVDIPAFDCFQFVWFALKKLVEAKIIVSQIQKYEPTFDMIKKLKAAQIKGYFRDFKSFADLKTCGVVFYTKTPSGWENMHERHIGFYFVQKDGVILISNHKHEHGVVQENFSYQEFVAIFSNFPDCIVA